MSGRVLASFMDVNVPRHLSLDSEGHVLVADCHNDRILLLNSELQLQHVLINTDSQVELWRPARLSYNVLTSQLYVIHRSSSGMRALWPDMVSVFSLH